MSEKVVYGILGRPVVTEKTTAQKDKENKIVFRVSKSANKIQIRQTIEKLFSVRVLQVNTMIMPGKPKRLGKYSGRRSGFKKAVVTLAEGDAIEFYATEGEL
jgi:large subunit ribosomal protein L23